MSQTTPNDAQPTESTGSYIAVSDANDQHNPTTKFADDTLGFTAKQPLANSGTKDLVGDLISAGSQTIIDYLKRPTILTSGVFSSTDAGILFTYDPANMIIPRAPRTEYLYTIRCGYKITINVNADRFQLGRYIVFWLPNGGATAPSTLKTSAYAAAHLANLTTITQLPHVEIDLATQTHATLDIPYSSIYPMNTWSTTNSTFSFSGGLVGIIPYYALDPGSGGSTNCGYTLWGSMQDIVIGSASANQMDMGTREAKAQGVGPVTATFAKVSKATNELGSIPVIGEFARQLSWFTGVLARSTKIMGWSKPTALAAPTRINRQIANFSANYDMVSLAKPLGLSSENSVIMPDVAVNNYDEMSVDFIKSQYAYLNTYQWPSSNVAGATLAAISVGPNLNTAWSKGQVYPPVCFLAQNFAVYRGGFKFRVKLVKTPFHRGRLAISFSPGVNQVTYTLAQSEYIFREIFDVSTTSEFEVCCPYLLTQPWVATTSTIIGVLTIHVVDPLVAPTSVSNTIPLLIEIAGAEDFEVGIPINWQVEPYSPSTTQGAYEYGQGVTRYQMAESYTETPCFVLGKQPSPMNHEWTKYTLGEAVGSIRQVLKRFWQYKTFVATVGSGAYFIYYPYNVIPTMQATGTSGALIRAELPSDPMNLWSMCYAFSTGTVRFMIKPVAAGNGNIIDASFNPGVGTSFTLYTSSTGYAAINYQTNTYMAQSIEGAFELQSPNWNLTLGRATAIQMVNNPGGISTTSASNNGSFLIGDSAAAAAFSVQAGRSAGEDFGLSRWVSTVPTVLTTAT